MSLCSSARKINLKICRSAFVLFIHAHRVLETTGTTCKNILKKAAGGLARTSGMLFQIVVSLFAKGKRRIIPYLPEQQSRSEGKKYENEITVRMKSWWWRGCWGGGDEVGRDGARFTKRIDFHAEGRRRGVFKPRFIRGYANASPIFRLPSVSEAIGNIGVFSLCLDDSA